MMSKSENPPAVTPDDVQTIARAAGLHVDAERAAALAPALDADLSVIRRLRGVDAGEIHPLGATALVEEASHDLY